MGFKDLPGDKNKSKDKKSPSVEIAKEIAPKNQSDQKSKK